MTSDTSLFKQILGSANAIKKIDGSMVLKFDISKPEAYRMLEIFIQAAADEGLKCNPEEAKEKKVIGSLQNNGVIAISIPSAESASRKLQRIAQTLIDKMDIRYGKNVLGEVFRAIVPGDDAYPLVNASGVNWNFVSPSVYAAPILTPVLDEVLPKERRQEIETIVGEVLLPEGCQGNKDIPVNYRAVETRDWLAHVEQCERQRPAEPRVAIPQSWIKRDSLRRLDDEAAKKRLSEAFKGL